jgi:hypothetical protein
MASIFHDNYGFLSKQYWKEQDELTSDIEETYDLVINHTSVFSTTPQSTLYFLCDEWECLESVQQTLDEFEEETDMQTMYISNWKNDEGIEFFTLIFKNDDDELLTITRMRPIPSLSDVPERLLSTSWHPIKLFTVDGEKLYIWESNVMNGQNFVELFSNEVTRAVLYNSDSEESS